MRGDVRLQLVERFAADAAGSAVLEEEDGALDRLGDGGLEHIQVRQVRQVWHRIRELYGLEAAFREPDRIYTGD